jgi:hypothetical protein
MPLIDYVRQVARDKMILTTWILDLPNVKECFNDWKASQYSEFLA